MRRTIGPNFEKPSRVEALAGKQINLVGAPPWPGLYFPGRDPIKSTSECIRNNFLIENE